MANKVQLKRSAVPGKVPATTDLDLGEIAINTYDGKAYIKKNVSGTESVVALGGAGSGDVTGPNSSTDNAIARFDGVSGKVIQSSGASIDDSGNMTAVTSRASGTGANKMPVGTTAQRPTGEAGAYRLNSTLGWPEYWDTTSSSWRPFGFDVVFQASYLVIAGGGAGGAQSVNAQGGGGGAGGYRASTVNLTVGQQYTITVGAGGARATGYGGNGGNSSITGGTTDITSIGGGGGAGNDQNTNGLAGGSGGGATNDLGTTGGAGTAGQGNNGGGGNNNAGGGGGGAGAVGQNGVSNGVAGAGGAGLASSITGTSVTRGGGGGGGANTPGAGGSGGGGAGTSSGTATSGTANTGGGGGGCANATAGNGGSGVVILSIPTIYYTGTHTGSPTVTTSGSNTILTFTGSGSYTA